jgi:SP family arabinose:H+ symporter-like MFS transporter
VLFTFFAIWKVDNWGRRPLYLLGTVGATLSLLVTGYLFNQGQVNNIALIIAILSSYFSLLFPLAH